MARGRTPPLLGPQWAAWSRDTCWKMPEFLGPNAPAGTPSTGPEGGRLGTSRLSAEGLEVWSEQILRCEGAGQG